MKTDYVLCVNKKVLEMNGIMFIVVHIFSKLRKQYLNLEYHYCGKQNNERKICLFKSGDMTKLMNLATFVTEIMNNFKDK